jgi:histidine kinase/DNA gyrase B/HSP90-like ATPase/response regulator receiver domain-containing protein
MPVERTGEPRVLLVTEGFQGPARQPQTPMTGRSPGHPVTTRIVRNLSAFARRQSGQRSIFSLTDVVRAVLELHGHQLAAGGDQRRGGRPVRDRAGAPQPRHERALRVVNAGCGERLTIRTRVTATAVHLAVSDDGPGIPADVLPHVFEPFFTTKGEDGSGLGLAIAHDIITRHGGRIRAESAPGAGTIILIELPRLRPGEPAAPPARPTLARSDAPRGPVLVVDDEPEVGELIADLLRSRGFDCEYVRSASAALERVRARAFIGVITDVRMPDMSGEDLWRVLRAERPELAQRTSSSPATTRRPPRWPPWSPPDSPVSPNRSAAPSSRTRSSA